MVDMGATQIEMETQIQNNDPMDPEEEKEESDLDLPSESDANAVGMGEPLLRNMRKWLKLDPKFITYRNANPDIADAKDDLLIHVIGNVIEPRLKDIAQNGSGLSIYDALAMKYTLAPTGCKKFWYAVVPFIIVILSISSILAWVMREAIVDSDRPWCFYTYYKIMDTREEESTPHLVLRVVGVGLSILLGFRVKDRCNGIMSRGLYVCMISPRDGGFIALPQFVNINFVKCGYIMNVVTLVIALVSSNLLIYVSENVTDMIQNAVIVWFMIDVPYYVVSSGYYEVFEEALASEHYIGTWTDNIDGEVYEQLRFIVYKDCIYGMKGLFKFLLVLTPILCYIGTAVIAGCY